MAGLSISKAWEEGVGFAGREFGRLYPIALLLFEVPALASYLIMPQMTPTPEVTTYQGVIESFGGLSNFLLFFALSLVTFGIQTFGALAISWLALNPGMRVADSFAIAARRLPPAFGAIMLMSLGLMLLMFPVWLLIRGASQDPSPGTALSILLPALLAALLVLAISPRLAVTTPVSVAERKGPVGIVARSWRLTKGHYWRLFGAFLLIGFLTIIVGLVVMLVFGSITALLVGPPEASFTAAFVLDLLNALFYAAYAVFLCSFVARIYAQLTAGEVDRG